MIYGYIRVSTDKQSVDNQRFEILKYANDKNFHVGHWIEETVSTTKKLADRKLGQLLKDLKEGDILIATEMSRLGRSVMEVMSILHTLMEKDVFVYTVKEKYEMGNNINSKVLAFAFSLSADIERQLISQRTKAALARRKAEGKTLGRPKGALSKSVKLAGKEDQIREMLSYKMPATALARMFGVHHITMRNFIRSRNLAPQPDS